MSQGGNLRGRDWLIVLLAVAVIFGPASCLMRKWYGPISTQPGRISPR